MSNSIFDNPPLGQRSTAATQSSIGTLATVTGTIAATHKVSGPFVRTTLTLTDVAQTVVNGTEYQSTLLWTMPFGHVEIFDTEISLAQKTTTDPATTLNASSTGAFSIGSAAASATTLNSTMANFLPSTAFTSGATINVAGSTFTGSLDANGDFSEAFKLDGTSTAVKVYMNSSFATTTDVDADATQKFSGTIIITWALLSYPQSLF